MKREKISEARRFGAEGLFFELVFAKAIVSAMVNQKVYSQRWPSFLIKKPWVRKIFVTDCCQKTVFFIIWGCFPEDLGKLVGEVEYKLDS